MPEFFLTADGRKEIPAEVISEGRDAVEAYIAKQGWQPPPPKPKLAPDAPADASEAPADDTPDESED